MQDQLNAVLLFISRSAVIYGSRTNRRQDIQSSTLVTRTTTSCYQLEFSNESAVPEKASSNEG